VLAAGRILGTDVGSTTPAFLTLLAAHVAAALTAVLSGAIAALSQKGTARHVRAGRWYYRAITAVFATATALAAMRWQQDYRLFIIGAVAFTAAFAGRRHRLKHRPGDSPHITGMGLSYVAMLTAFYVDNGPHLPGWDNLPPLSFWFIPGLVGAPVILRALYHARQDAAARPDRRP
jgi:hypothetical protein